MKIQKQDLRLPCRKSYRKNQIPIKRCLKKTFIPKVAFRIYLMVTLLTAVLFSYPPYSVTALFLLLAQIYSFRRPLRARVDLALIILTFLFMPLTLQPIAGWLPSALLAIPVLPLLDWNLKANARNQFSHTLSAGRKPSITLKVLATTLFLLLIISFILANRTLSLTTILLLAYLIAILLHIVRCIPGKPAQEIVKQVRVVAGNKIEVPLIIQKKARTPLHLRLSSPFPWIHIAPSQLELRKDESVSELTITPLLAGPSRPHLQALFVDPWGLTQINQILEPVELFVIPRARYAEWLAKKYLEQTTAGAATTVMAPSARTPRRGRERGEYYGNRCYQPGDRLKDIDWKQTSKLQKLIVKEYIEAHGQAAILVMNLATRDAEEADRLAYNFITSALTLAQEGVPTALVAYNQEDALLPVPPSNPREMLKKTLKLAQNIIVVPAEERLLQPPNIRRLKRTVNQLRRGDTESSQRLADILSVEYEALQEVARTHVATKALRDVAEYIPPPAIITVISSLNHDSEALTVILDKLEGKGYHSLTLRTQGSRIQ